DERAVSELLRELEFHSLLNELTPAQASLPTSVAQRSELEVAAAEVPALIARLAHAPRLALYLEDGETRPETPADESDINESQETNGSCEPNASLDFNAGAKAGGTVKASAAANSSDSARLKIGAEGENETYVLPS